MAESKTWNLWTELKNFQLNKRWRQKPDFLELNLNKEHICCWPRDGHLCIWDTPMCALPETSELLQGHFVQSSQHQGLFSDLQLCSPQWQLTPLHDFSCCRTTLGCYHFKLEKKGKFLAHVILMFTLPDLHRCYRVCALCLDAPCEKTEALM